MIKCDLLIKNTVVMTDYETVKTGMDIGIKGERILFVSEKGTEEVQAQKVIRGEGKLFYARILQTVTCTQASSFKRAGSGCKADYLDKSHASF